MTTGLATAAKVKERADDLVRKAEVRKQVRTETALSERVLIEATAEVVAAVRMEHRGDIRRAREITNALLMSSAPSAQMLTLCESLAN